MKTAKTYIIVLLSGLLFMSCKKETEREITEHNDITISQNLPTKTFVETAKPKPANKNKKLRDSIIAYAENYLGTQYCYASADPVKGFDCSGFVNYIFKNFDIEVPRSSKLFKNLAPSLKPKDFKKGDVLVFYGYRDSTSIGHVGIVYEADGMNSKFIHASSGGDKEVMISDLGSDMYTERFYKCINVLNLK